jgi:predicted cobalt transporter CbtA
MGKAEWCPTIWRMAETFVAMSLSTNAVFWIVLGVATAYIFDRFARTARSREPVNGA